MVHLTHRSCVLAFLLLLISCFAQRASAAERTLTKWVLERGHDIPSKLTHRPQLAMEGQKLSGSSGCNSFTATLIEKADKRVAIERVGLTRMLCAPAQNKVEAAVVRALEQTEYVNQKGRTLTFLSGKRQPLLIWTRNQKTAVQELTRRKHHARGHRLSQRATVRWRRCWNW
jgi:heat shock protein HslJ